ncbi:hypothetical protein IL59_0210895 [Brucella suis bv. 4 str. 40]|nr:hypothetical protein IL59_0210895 [Brucella suis bv. 4 str. 40]
MLEIERLAGLGEFLGDIAGPVVSHHPRDGDAKACIVGDGSFEKGYGADGFFIREYVGEADAGSIIDADMDIFPADPARVALSRPVACDPMADALETPKPLDVEMDQAPGSAYS